MALAGNMAKLTAGVLVFVLLEVTFVAAIPFSIKVNLLNLI